VFSFLQISSSKHSTHLDQFATLIITSHQNLGPLSVLFPSDLFIKTLNKPRPNRHINNILPSKSGPPKYSLSYRFLHQNTAHLDQITTLIITSHQILGPLSFLFPSDFFIKTLFTPRPNCHFNNNFPTNCGLPKCSLSFRFLYQNTLHVYTKSPF